jgi:hypothetical protein
VEPDFPQGAFVGSPLSCTAGKPAVAPGGGPFLSEELLAGVGEVANRFLMSSLLVFDR